MSQYTALFEEELSKLSLYQRSMVLLGLRNKLSHYKKVGYISYKYEVCPICNDIGSTLENPKCGECYIEKTCKVPFEQDFRYNHDEGVKYFTEMYEYLMSDGVRPNAVVVGGNWDDNGGKASKIALMMAGVLNADIVNGGNVNRLDNVDVSKYDLVVWMTNVSNEEPKHYPKKKQGATLVVSKVMREGVTSADAAARIFAMGGNAVIEIYSGQKRLEFRLADALSNEWYRGYDYLEVAKTIQKLAEWTKGSIRLPTYQTKGEVPDVKDNAELTALLSYTKVVADKVENEVGKRYFGNVSTRCMKMFPSMKSGQYIIVSPRNIDKKRIEPEDMVLVFQDVPGTPMLYYGNRKPSVDTGVQMDIYRERPNVRYMIHGHAYIKDAEYTKEYFPCGDMREVPDVLDSIRDTHGVINLVNHGFLMYTETLEQMEELVTKSEFINRL